MRAFWRIVSARPGFEVVVGVLAVIFGLFLTLVLVAAEGITAQAFLPLVFAGYGIVHILIFTDVVGRKRCRKRAGRHC
jgi:hypothetical protein